MTKRLKALLMSLIFSMSGAAAGEIHRDDWYLNQPDNNATIQLSGHRIEKNARTYIQDHQITENAGYYQYSFKGKPWYSVTYGLYNNVDEARKELKNLPQELLASDPWTLAFSEIQSRISTAENQSSPTATVMSSPAELKEAAAEKENTQNILPAPSISAADTTINHEIIRASALATQSANRENWYMEQPDNYATIQLSGYRSEIDARAFILKHRLTDNSGYFKSIFKGKPWYSVTFGLYNDINKAQEDIRNLPDSLVTKAPLPRLFADIKASITSTGEQAQLLAEGKDVSSPTQKSVSKKARVKQEKTPSTSPAKPANSAEQTNSFKSISSATGVTENKNLSLNFQDADIRAVINTVSQITGKNFIIDPRVKGKVTLVSGRNLDPDTIYKVFLSVLDVHNIVAIDSNGLTKLIPKAVAKQSPTPTSFGKPELLGDEQITEIYKLKHGSVRDIVPILKPLLPPTSHFAAHGPSNTIILTDTASNIQRILAIIEKLDLEESVGDTRVIYLRHAQAKNVAALLTDLISSYQKSGDSKLKAKVSIQPHEATNALVIHAEEQEMQVIRKIIAQVDIRRAQVFVEAIIAEVSEDRLGQLGISWDGTNVNSNGQFSGATEYDIGSGGLRLGFLSGFLTNLTGVRVPEFQLVLHALRSDNESNVLSTPNLLTLDNEEAEIRVAQEVPFITGQFTTNVTTAQPAPPAGQPGAIVNPFQTIERKDVGLILKIKPQINEGSTVRLEISEELSNISPTRIAGASDLITNKRIVKSTVVVDDGQTIVLGGLILDDLSNTVDGVLGLSNVPFIGGLFRTKQKKLRKINLMLFIKPTIVRSKSDLVGFTERKYGAMRELQIDANSRSEYLIRDLKPTVMPPLDGTAEDVPVPASSKEKRKWWQPNPEPADECSHLSDVNIYCDDF
ncbi:MAG: secretin N-terminal domain-containing protein [Pseudomonadota bacterium]|nr:secretin N-terminal domain-containing protein [Pseudomonadota bacterium]